MRYAKHVSGSTQKQKAFQLFCFKNLITCTKTKTYELDEKDGKSKKPDLNGQPLLKVEGRIFLKTISNMTGFREGTIQSCHMKRKE